MPLSLNFKQSPLPNPPAEFDAQYIRQMIRVLELYFNQLDGWNVQTYDALTAAGATAERPAAGLYVGQYYFDTDLGIPIWYDGTNWVDATGATV